MTATKQLHEFEGREVHKAAIKIAGAGTGLSDSLKMDPVEIELGEDRYFVLRATCSRVSIEEDKSEITTRVHTMNTSEITLLEDEIAKRLLQAAADNLARRKAEIEGQQQIEFTEGLEGQEAIASLNERRAARDKDALDQALEKDTE